MKTPRIYFATRFDNDASVSKIIELNKRDCRWIAHGRWLQGWEHNISPTPANARDYWPENFQDVTNADAVVVFAEYSDTLSGTLLGVGAAIALNIPVYVVGTHHQFRCWVNHPAVSHCDTLTLEQVIDLVVFEFNKK